MVLIVIGLLCVFLPKCNGIRELQRRKAELQDENREIDRATKELRVKRERFKSDPIFVEQVAREAGMLRKDEIVFKFENNNDENTEQVMQ